MDLESGEHLIFEGHPSWRSILGFYLKGFEFAGVADPQDVVDAVHRALREADETATRVR